MNKELEDMMKKLSKGVKVMAVPEESMPISEGGEGFSPRSKVVPRSSFPSLHWGDFFLVFINLIHIYF